jgi:hypothetical protein
LTREGRRCSWTIQKAQALKLDTQIDILLSIKLRGHYS